MQLCPIILSGSARSYYRACPGLIKKINRYVEGDLEVFGLKINYKNIVEDLLNKERKHE
jgi:hypothetical protein